MRRVPDIERQLGSHPSATCPGHKCARKASAERMRAGGGDSYLVDEVSRVDFRTNSVDSRPTTRYIGLPAALAGIENLKCSLRNSRSEGIRRSQRTVHSAFSPSRASGGLWSVPSRAPSRSRA